MIFLALPDVEILDLAGPMQAFAEANGRTGGKYELATVAAEPTVASRQGLTFANVAPLCEAGPGTTIIVPGTAYERTRRVAPKILRWLRESHRAGARVAAVCTGAFVLGEAGLLDGRRCTTHWSRIDDLAARFPRARVIGDRLFVTDGDVVTSAGIASGIDMSLALIEEQHGPLIASEVARELVVYIRRNGAQSQASVYLDFRTHLHPGIHRVQDWIVQHPERNPTLDELAEVAGTSRRTLTRLFRNSTGISIKDYSQRVRIELARSLMRDPALSADAVAQRCGFAGARQLRRLLRVSSSRP